MNRSVKYIRNYLNFSGRASRTEFWYSMLIVVLFLAVIFAVMSFTQSIYIASALLLVLLVPYFAVVVRRLHDIGRSGWWVGVWVLLALASRILERYPVVIADRCHVSWLEQPVTIQFSLTGVVSLYGLLLFIWALRRSDRGDNKYGPQPKVCSGN